MNFWLDLAIDVVTLGGVVVAVVYSTRLKGRVLNDRARERERTDRLYKRLNERLADHIKSRLH